MWVHAHGVAAARRELEQVSTPALPHAGGRWLGGGQKLLRHTMGLMMSEGVEC